MHRVLKTVRGQAMEIAGGKALQVDGPTRAKALRWEGEVGFEEGGGQGGQRRGRRTEAREVMGARLSGDFVRTLLGGRACGRGVVTGQRPSAVSSRDGAAAGSHLALPCCPRPVTDNGRGVRAGPLPPDVG